MTSTRPQLPRRERTRSARLTVVGGMLVTLVGLLGVTLSTAAIHLGDDGPAPMAQLAGEEAGGGFDLAVVNLDPAGAHDAGGQDAGVQDAGVHDAVDAVRRTRPDVVVLSGVDAHRLRVLRDGLPGFGFWPETAPTQGAQRTFAWRLSAFDPVATGHLVGGVDGAGGDLGTSDWVHLKQRSTRRSVVVQGGHSAQAGSAGNDAPLAWQHRPRRAVLVVSPADGSAAAHDRVVGIGALSLRQMGGQDLQKSGLQLRAVRVVLAPRQG